MRKLIALSVGAWVAFSVTACKHQASKENHEPSAAMPAAATEEIRSIALPRYQANLPTAPGRDAFAAACLTCHSTRYIAMQPALSAAKWTESVQKMAKVYGAPIAEEQVPQIVQYLVQTKESGQWFADSLVAVYSAPPPKMVIWSDPIARNNDMQRGAALFAKTCASCHGLSGAGDGRSAVNQIPHPTDLTAVHYAPGQLAKTLRNGVPATAMPAWPTVSDDDVRAVVTYTQQLGPAPQKSIAKQTTDVQMLYGQNCQTCHGKSGGGDGPQAATLPRPPANFRAVQPSEKRAQQVIADGVPGTSMSGWKMKLSEEQRRLLTDYVRSFYAGQ
jgi:mono/diheme cytochrome c family protein